MRAKTAAVALSLGGHALLAWTTPATEPRPGLVWSAWDREVELTILVEEPTPEREREGSSGPPPPSASAAASPRRSSPRARVGASVMASATSVASPLPSEAEPSQDTAPPSADVPTDGADDPRLGAGDPRGVQVAPWQVMPSAAARGDVLAGAPGLTSGEDVERAMEEEIDDALREAARAPHLSTRPPPTLRPTRDGGYEWTGTGFVAHIEPDGAVRFSDLPGLRYEGLGPDPEAPDSFRDFVPARGALPPDAVVSVRFGFDLTDALERRRGNDPYYADRAWFLRETEEVRDRLARMAATERDRVQLLRLRGRWVALMEDRARPASVRRRALFSAWDELAEDEVGQRARDALLDLVRERWPRGSAEAFTEEELARLNEARVRRERFAPYTSVEPTRDVDEAADGR